MKVQKYEISRTIDKLKSIVQKNDQFPALGGVLVKDGYYVEITDRPLSWKKDIDLLTEYDSVRKEFLRRCGK